MRKLVLLCLAGITLPGFLVAQTAVENAVAALHWLDTGFDTGSDCIVTKIGGKTVYFDPVIDKMPVLPTGRSWPKADIIFWTHPHPDHYSLDTVRALRKDGTQFYGPLDISYQIEEDEIPGSHTVEPGSDFQEGDISIHAIPMYTLRDEDKHERWNNWVSYVLKVGGVTYLITGDSGLTPEIRAIQGVDVLLVNILANYMMTVGEAADLVATMRPTYCVPLHWNGSYEAEAPKLRALMPAGTTLKFLPLEKGVAW